MNADKIKAHQPRKRTNAHEKSDAGYPVQPCEFAAVLHQVRWIPSASIGVHRRL